jgi:hypothetical protein
VLFSKSPAQIAPGFCTEGKLLFKCDTLIGQNWAEIIKFCNIYNKTAIAGFFSRGMGCSKKLALGKN